ncbi:MAG: hypothetical protein ACE5Q6_11650 [Dehalococcoidia bacterium]
MIRVLCAWHPKYFPSEPVPVLRELPGEADRTSHGVCEACRTILKKPRSKIREARRERRLYNLSSPSTENWPARPPLPPKTANPNAIRTRSFTLSGTPRRNLIGLFTVKLYDEEKLEVLVHRRGKDIFLNDCRVDPGNQISELGWRREILLKVPNVVHLEFQPFNPREYGIGLMLG